ncbi:uncharacterized protein E0L32_004210 [Thyridium curvatum]|uniref:Uncharacterized protein n=1 Tax=Thyridium curvatum TaxID=1093900 RepID=A0A507AZF3_9PEZI|nr:uncharacterized protein E0L32_004210 [Thyridium curvatum]TPX16215.1 hypothetical protein E0L32_004210 [Thyridium curvatum]
MALTQPYWDPGHALDIANYQHAYEVQCVGWAHTRGARCGWRIRDPDASKICAVMSRMAGRPPGQTTSSDLQTLAKLCLCKDWHYDQWGGIARSWEARVRSESASYEARVAKARAAAAAAAQAAAPAVAAVVPFGAAQPANSASSVFVFGANNPVSPPTPPPSGTTSSNNSPLKDLSRELAQAKEKLARSEAAHAELQKTSQQAQIDVFKANVRAKELEAKAEAAGELEDRLKQAALAEARLRAAHAAEVARFEGLVKEAHANAEDLTKYMRETQEELAQLRLGLADEVEKGKALARVNEDLEGRLRASEGLHAEVDRLRAEAEVLRARNGNLEAEAGRLRGDADLLGQRNEKLAVDVEQLAVQKSSLASQVGQLQARLGTAEGRNKQLSEQLAASAEAHQRSADEARAAREANAGLQGRVANLRLRIGQLEASASASWLQRFRAWVGGVKKTGSKAASAKGKAVQHASVAAGKRPEMTVTPVSA